MPRIIYLALASFMLLSVTPTFANNVTFSTQAALTGNHGIEVVMDGSTNSAYLVDLSPTDETAYRAEFRIAHNNLVMAEGSNHGVFYGRMEGGTGNVIRLNMALLSGEYKITVRCLKDVGGTAFCGKFTFAPNTTRVKLEWKAATAPGANNGIFRLYKGDTLQFEKTNLDTDTLQIDTARLGVTKNADATTLGSYYIDQFSSDRNVQ